MNDSKIKFEHLVKIHEVLFVTPLFQKFINPPYYKKHNEISIFCDWQDQDQLNWPFFYCGIDEDKEKHIVGICGWVITQKLTGTIVLCHNWPQSTRLLFEKRLKKHNLTLNTNGFVEKI